MSIEVNKSDWNKLKNNPDNWLVIPEFNVRPMDVNFCGFLQPIVGENTKDTFFYSAVRVIVSEVRGHAFKRFKSLAALERINDDASLKFMSDVETEGFLLCKPIGDELFGYRYDCIFAYISQAVEAYSKNKIECIEMLSCATVEVAKMMTNAASDPDHFKKLMHRQLSSSGGHGKQAKSPKTPEKNMVEEFWIEWQKEPLMPNGDKKYKSTPRFARDMQEKFTHLESQAVIERWCREWKKMKKDSLPVE